MTTPRLITFYIESYFTGMLQAISRITVGFRTVLSLRASLKIVNDYTRYSELIYYRIVYNE